MKYRSLADKMRDHEGFYTTKELAAILSVHPDTLREDARLNRIPSVLISGKRKYDPHAIADWLEARSIPAR